VILNSRAVRCFVRVGEELIRAGKTYSIATRDWLVTWDRDVKVFG
jgi:hypothetical protein